MEDSKSKHVPLHVLMRQYRVLFIVITVYFMWLTNRMWFWFETNSDTMTNAAGAAFGSLALASVGAIKWAMENAKSKHELDDEHRSEERRDV